MSVTPLELYKISNEISDDKKHLNKYTYTGNEFKFPHYRILSLKELMLSGLHQRLPLRQKQFIEEEGEVLLIANIIAGYIPLVQLRSIHGEKRFEVIGSQSKLFYGQGYLDKNFKFGDWVIIVEGIMDSDIGRGLYPNILANMTSKITKSQFEILKLLTNRVILIGDNDRPGRIGTKANRKLLQENGFDVRLIFQYGDFKDLGDLAEALLNNDGYVFNTATKYYRSKINNIVNR